MFHQDSRRTDHLSMTDEEPQWDRGLKDPVAEPAKLICSEPPGE
jgi:hypothetical protein